MCCAMRNKMNIVIWIFIGLLFVATAAWTVWAGRQPHSHSIWAPDTDESIPP